MDTPIWRLLSFIRRIMIVQSGTSDSLCLIELKTITCFIFPSEIYNLFYISEGYYNLGDYFYGIGKLDSALTNYQLSVDAAKEGNNLLFQKDGLVQISSIYDSLKKHEEHVLVLKQIVDIQDELSKQRFSEEFKALKMSYEQSYNEAISIGGMREQELETKVGAIESVFNNWLVISVLCFLGFMTFIFLLKRSKNK